jgi:fatty-acyl-CoA synthase
MRAKSYISGTSEKALLGYTVGELFDKIAAKYAEKDALVVKHQDIRWSYREFREIVNQCAFALLESGIERGDRVGIWSPNCAEWAIIQFATAKIGAILVNINPSYRLHELAYALNQSGCKMLVIADKFKYADYTKMIYDLIPELHHFEAGKLKSEKVPVLKTVVRIHPERSGGMLTWNSFMERGLNWDEERLQNIAGTLSFDDPINIQYTSGTTGTPKGATLTHHNILNNGYFVSEIMNFTAKDRLVIPVPLYHCFGMVLGNLGCITHGATIIYPAAGFDVEAVLQAVEEEKATALYGVPTMFIAELRHPSFSKYDLSSLRTGIMAGAPCPIEVMKEVKEKMHMKEVQIAYGMTETSPVSTQTRTGTSLEKQVSTVGQVHPHQEIKIVDPETNLIVNRGIAGELCTRGYSVMQGYWNDKKRTKQVIDKAGWMHSGDLAIMDEEGYIKIVGRIKDMIIRGGENIYPREIEEFLHTHPQIQNVQVIGVPDAKYGEEVMAWVKLKEGSITKEELQEFCKSKIAYYKIPRYIKFVDEFPMTVTGKIRKVEMREISIRELALESEKLETA